MGSLCHLVTLDEVNFNNILTLTRQMIQWIETMQVTYLCKKYNIS